ncbi:MAG: hypothetical protein N3A69_16710, partial [Leptospiraceae bacterium]|nr:hypothetical protein [Leptospiraceae bacterium]
LELYGKLNEYLEITPGIMNSSIKKFIRPEYSTSVLSAINHFNAKQTPYIGNWQRKKRDAKLDELFRVKLLPFSESNSDNLILLFFESILLKNEEELILQNLNVNELLERNKELEKELISTKEVLQTYIEELETTNEELQASNEELMSINEELQATNEELETTNEELQSTNEELQTAYTEMKTLNESLEISKEKLKKVERNLHLLIDTNPQGFVLLDSSYRIQEFNKIATKLSEAILNKSLKKEESFLDFNFLDTVANLKDIFTKVVNGKIIEVEKQLQIEKEVFNWYHISYYPILALEKVEAIAIFILDITDKKKSLEMNESLMIQLNLELETKTKELVELNHFLEAELDKERRLVQELELMKKELLLTKEKYKVLTSNIPASDLFLFDKDFKVLL